VRQAADALGELIGVIRTDDVLEVVFRQFCVGK
jgi:tRNA U34 5-carboxymethylaminomethyl modifying GTPase MnmE/TrmE